MIMTNHDGDPVLSRRRFLQLGSLMAAATAFAPAAQAKLLSDLKSERVLSFYNVHTGESLKSLVWADGQFIPESLQDINRLLRDHRRNEYIPMDGNLVNILWGLNVQLENAGPIHIISGYRSPQTNARLAAEGRGVARNSMHTVGRAIDLFIPGQSLRNVHTAALNLRAGGVGYYPGSNFVHVDTGALRTWRG